MIFAPLWYVIVAIIAPFVLSLYLFAWAEFRIKHLKAEATMMAIVTPLLLVIIEAQIADMLWKQ